MQNKAAKSYHHYSFRYIEEEMSMNETAVINGKEYRFIKTVTEIGTNRIAVLCEDEHGCSFICDTELWESSAVKPKAEFNKYATPDRKIELFKSLFIGREDVYAKRFYNMKKGTSGYVPACANEWVQGVCDKKRYKCTECPNKSFIAVNNRVLFNHLKGDDEFCRDVIGTYVMLPNEMTRFLAIDFDEESWQEDVSAVRLVCDQYNIPVAVERSRSGNGAHVWLFFEKPVPAISARKLGSAVLTKVMDKRHEIKLSSYDRMFPNQDTMSKGGFGNLIALPLQGKARKDHNTEFVDEAFRSYPDQWEYLYHIKRIAADELDRSLSVLCVHGELGELRAEDETPWERKAENSITAFDFPDTIKVVEANLLYIEKSGISQKALNKIKRLAAFKNPDFYKSQAMRLPVYNKPRVIDTSEETEQYLCIPRGCKDSLTDLVESTNSTINFIDERNAGNPIRLHFNGQLREEQQLAAYELLKFENGILSATTAFGKTVVASYLISERKVNTLILVHSSALLQQWQKSLSEFLIFEDELPELPKRRGRQKKLSHIGQLGATKNTLNSIVDIAIMQSVVSGDDVKGFVKNYGMVIVDECHHVSAFTFEKILREVNAKYVYGLTATPKRQDGHQPIITMQCGPIRYQVDALTQSVKREFSHYVIPEFTDFRIADTDLKYQEICAKLCTDETRNRRIVNDVITSYQSGRNCIVLTERTDHADILYTAITENRHNVFLLSGKDKAKEKREKLDAIKAVPQGENMIIVATGKYVGEGFDEPRLDTLFLAMPISWKGTLAQYVGRLHRDYEGKIEVIVHDYADIFVPMLDRMYHKRIRGYAELGYMMNGSSRAETSLIYDAGNFFGKYSDDIVSTVKEIIISALVVRSSYLKRVLSQLSDTVKLTIITPQTEGLEAIGNITYVFKEKVTQTFTVIDRQIVWYGNINPLSYNRSDSSVLRLINTSLAGKLVDEAVGTPTLFE